MLVDSADGGQFAIFELAEAMDGPEVDQLQKSVSQLVSLQSVEGDLVPLSSILVQRVEDAPLLPDGVLLCDSVTFLSYDQDSSRFIFDCIEGFGEVLLALTAHDVIDSLSKLFLTFAEEAPLANAFPQDTLIVLVATYCVLQPPHFDLAHLNFPCQSYSIELGATEEIAEAHQFLPLSLLSLTVFEQFAEDRG